VLGAVYVADGWRTPFCRAGGPLARSSPQALAVAVVRAFTDRGFAPESADEIVLGNVLNGRGNLARYAALGAGLPVTVPGCTIDRQCASGLEAVAHAYYRIGSGSAGSMMIAGGVESMSQAPFLMSRATRAFDRSPPCFLDVPLSPPEIGDPSMIETAELVAAEAAIRRPRMDAFAVASHQKATAAMREGRFRAELISIATLDEAGRSTHVTADHGPREDASLPKLEALRPVVSGGTVTAGNASGLADGAAAVVVMDEAALVRSGRRPLARIVDTVCVGVDPARMGMGPVPAVQRLLARHALSIAQVDLWEINEAFAGQVLAVVERLGLDPDQINSDGGAIALGHPLGATGARIIGHLAHTLAASPNARFGVAALCVGGGMGMAMLLESSS
jgi:acetyl-CoA acetyltransferase family protein